MTIAKLFLMTLAVAAATLAYDGDTFAARFDALPQAVKDTARANMENTFPVSIAAAKSEQGWDYQINTRLNGKYHDLVINAAGKLVAVKDETDLASIPAAAKAAIEKQASSARIMALEKVTEGGQVSYGAVMKQEGQATVVQLRVTADGTLKSKN